MRSAKLEASPTWDRGDSAPCAVEKRPRKPKGIKQNPLLFSETLRTLNPNSAVPDPKKDSHGALREMQPAMEVLWTLTAHSRSRCPPVSGTALGSAA